MACSLVGGQNADFKHLGFLKFYGKTKMMQELLALEEKMGIVSTALSEEALLKSLKSSIYRPADESGDICRNKDDDIKCSICQVLLLSSLSLLSMVVA